MHQPQDALTISIQAKHAWELSWALRSAGKKWHLPMLQGVHAVCPLGTIPRIH